MNEYTDSMLSRHFCDRDEGWQECGAHGIPIAFVCEICVDVKMRPYREFNRKNIKLADAKKELKNEH
jgi:hypothetical protein